MSSAVRKRDVLGWTMAVLGLTLLLRLVAYGPITGPPSPAGPGAGAGAGTGGAGLKDSSASFTIAGTTVDPISPGVMAPLDLRLTNPHELPMLVTNLRVKVRKVSAPNADADKPCVIGDYAVDQVSQSLVITVAAHATSTLSNLGLARATWPRAGMLDRPVNQDGCKGASLTLDYAASGTLKR
jgi:hypothetical protein